MSIKSVLFIGAPMVLICIVLAKPILLLASSTAYLESILLFRLYSITTFIGWLSIILIGYLNAINFEMSVVKVSALSLAFKVLVNIPAIYYWGALGAIASSVVCELFIMASYSKTLWGHIEKRKIFRYTIELFVPLGISFIALKLLASRHVIATLTVGVLAYGAAVKLMHILKPKET